MCSWEFRNIEEGYSRSESCLKQLLVYETDVKFVFHHRAQLEDVSIVCFMLHPSLAHILVVDHLVQLR